MRRWKTSWHIAAIPLTRWVGWCCMRVVIVMRSGLHYPIRPAALSNWRTSGRTFVKTSRGGADDIQAAQGAAAAACAGWPLCTGSAAGRIDGLKQSQPIDAAYAACRAIAKREAKNFYYAFVALPAHKRDAMCAVYAFMRHADDISDDESKDPATRREELADWTAAWRDGEATADPVFVAVRDTQRRFNIPNELLEQLIHGTAMDVEPEAANRRGADGLDTFATFTDLYRYCYYVASIVGLVCIRIFGYSNPAAERLAEETGIAFQLTNILRDVREDAERGRVYIPSDDLKGSGTSSIELAQIKT